jgi:hypothetical protein
MSSIIGVILRNVLRNFGLSEVGTVLDGLTDAEKRKVIRLTWPSGSSESESLYSMLGLGD